jgi:hypothetical protein
MMARKQDSPPPQSQAGIDRAGTGHGGPADTTDAGRPDAAAPATQRPGDEEGPTIADGSQEPPDPHVSTVPLETEDGDTVVIAQQNQGGTSQVGAGEFKEPGAASHRKDPAEAAREQQELEREAPIGFDGLTAHGEGSDRDERGSR